MEVDSDSLLHNLQINLPTIVYNYCFYYSIGFYSYLYPSFNFQPT